MRRALALAGVIVASVGSILLTPAVASATPQQQTKTVTWVTQLAPNVTTPTGADDVTWPQTLGAYAPECDAVLQIDVYRYGNKTDKGIVDALIAHGTLNKPGSATWTDSAVVISWKFVVLPPCNSPTPTPTPTITPTPTPSCGTDDQPACETPTPTPTETPTSTQTPLGCSDGNLAACPPTPTPTPSVTPSPSASVLPTLTATPSPSPAKPSPPKTLPFTGANDVVQTGWIAFGLVVTGGLLLCLPFLIRNNRRARR